MRRLGLVFSGGGAQGAYEAGVVRFLCERVAPQLGGLNFEIVCGSSVGALNGTWFAGQGFDAVRAQQLSGIWQGMLIEHIFRFETWDLLGMPRLLMTTERARMGLLNPKPLHGLIRELFPAEGLRDRIRRGELLALTVSATEIFRGQSVQFIQGDMERLSLPRSLPSLQYRDTLMQPEHVMASAAIPFVFPPVEIEGQTYVDGSLLQNTPLLPALRLGADRILILSVDHSRPEPPPPVTIPDSAGLLYLLGQTLNTLLIDPLVQDLHTMEQFNSIFRLGREVYGEDFLDRLNAALPPGKRQPYREVQTMMIQPQEDMGRIAGELYRHESIEMNRPTRILLSRITSEEGYKDTDLLSFLLFDGVYTGCLERLGWEDARAREQELLEFLS